MTDEMMSLRERLSFRARANTPLALSRHSQWAECPLCAANTGHPHSDVNDSIRSYEIERKAVAASSALTPDLRQDKLRLP